MFYCPFCGARRFTCWPLFWPWQYKGELYCSYNCWICDSTRQERERKGYKMARMRKDGTPAKKPGPKAKKELNIGKDEVKATPPTVKLDGAIRIETPEAHNVDIVETPEQAVIKDKVVDIMEELKIRNPLQYEEFTVREVEGLFGRYRYTDIGSAVYIDFENVDRMDTLSFTVDQWRKFREEQEKAAKILGVEL